MEASKRVAAEVGRARVAAAVQPAADRPLLRDVTGVLRQPLPDDVLKTLGERGIRTLADWSARRAGVDLDPRVAEELDAHAALSLLPSTPEVNARLVDAGVVSPLQIARLSRAEFTALVAPRTVPAEVAERLHGAAEAQERLLSNAVTAARTGSGAVLRSSYAATACGCVDCRSATSPAAYLADLLDYAVRHLRSVVVTQGLRGEYFAGSFVDSRLVRVDPVVDFDWGTGAPDASLPADGFSVRWTGILRPRYSEPYDFHVTSDDNVLGVRLWFDGQLVVSPTSFSNSDGTERFGSIVLHADQPYDLRLEYVDSGGAAKVRLSWSSWTQGREVVPTERLSIPDGAVPIALSGLEERLGQPLRGLLDRCDFVEHRVHRARLAAEAVRTLLPAAHRGVVEPSVLYLVYDALLAQLGTSYGDLRRIVAHNDARERLRYAFGLGIADADTPDRLDELLLDVGDPRVFTEEAVERVFGYASTTRSPLDPDAEAAVLGWRLEVLRHTWVTEDRAADRPLIDPDLVGPPDFVDPSPSPSLTRPAVRPMDLYEDRRHWADLRAAEIRTAVADPRAGFTSLITGTFDDNGTQRPLFFGLGVSVADFESVVGRQRAGEDISTDLVRLLLDEDALAYVGWAWQVSGKPGGLTEPEWRLVTDVFVEHGKRQLYINWRDEETAAGIAVTPDQFVLRPAPGPGEPAWAPRRFRSTVADRRAWTQTLKRRIVAAQTLREQWTTAVDDVETRYRVHQRDALVIAYGALAPPPRLTREGLVDRLQLDLNAGPTQTTTRVAQAIESVQGLLHGARNGLLDRPGLVSSNVDGFDDAWRWLGSYATWRAALRVFLYPENALKTTLRRNPSGALSALIERLRNAGPLDPRTALREAETYEEYFRDVCRLSFEGLGRVTAEDGQPTDEPWHVIVARGGHTGRLYAAVQDFRPEQWLLAGYRRGSWHEIPGLEPDVEVVGMVDQRDAAGRATAGLYVRAGQPGRRRVLYTRHDGVGWTPPREVEDESLVVVSLRAQTVPPGPTRAATGGAGWSVATTDDAVALDLDGDGRAELLLIRDTNGDRPVGVLRTVAGGLTVDVTGELPAGWRLPAGEPVVLRTTLTQSPDRRREQVLVVGTQAGQPAIGILGLTGGGVGLLGVATGTLPGPGGGWTVSTTARFVGSDIDGDGFTELVVVEDLDASHRRLTVLNIRENSVGVRSTQVIETDDGFAGVIPEQWLWIRAAEGGIVALREWQGYTALQLTQFPWNAATNQFIEWGALSTVLWLQGAAEPIGFDGQSGLAPYAWLPGRDDDLRRSRVGLAGAGMEYLVTSDSRAETAFFRFRAVPQGAEAKMVWRSRATMPAVTGQLEWERSTTDVFVLADLDGDGHQEVLLVNGSGSAVAVARRTPGNSLELHWSTGAVVRAPGGGNDGAWPATSGARFLVGDFDGDGAEEIVVLGADTVAVLRGQPPRRSAYELGLRQEYGPSGVTEFAVLPSTSPRWTTGREGRIASAYQANMSFGPTWTDPDLTYLDEAYFFLPMELAQRLKDAGHPTVALDWLRAQYDYDKPADQRKRAYLLVLNGEEELTFARAADWLTDPLNPHLVARTRRDSYTRFTILAVARCLSDAADEEHTRGTAESLPRARELYLRALDLLAAPELAESATGCADLIGTLDLQVGDDEFRWLWHQVTDRLGALSSLSVLTDAVRDIHRIVRGDGELRDRIAEATARVAEAERLDVPGLSAYERDAHAAAEYEGALFADPGFRDLGRVIGERFDSHFLEVVPAPRPSYCIPPNPAVDALRRHIQLALAKLRDSRNVAGLRVTVEPYAPDSLSTGPDGLPAPQRGFQPLPYRYATLVERARQLVDAAAQLEQSMLAAIQAGDQARYEELRARHDLGLARSGVRLKDLQLVQASHGIRAAERQRDRAVIAAQHYEKLLAAGLTDNEQASLGFLYGTAILHAAAAASNFVGAYQVVGIVDGGIAQAVGSGLSSLANAASTTSQILGQYAAYERRAQDWRLNANLSTADIRLGDQEVLLATDTARIAGQERDIALLQVDHAEEILDFLVLRRFATAELYEWMAALLEAIYRFFLQQATSMAQLAEAQLAFERQEVPPAFIRADYWRVPTESGGASVDDRRGLTGSARLLRDLTELDQYAFGTERRKLQLTKTFSLGELDPVAFQRFRETGVLPFRTATELFDRDFPGHYLRLVKRVRTTVIALVPPVHGIHATLSTTGPSRTVVGGDTYDTVVVQRAPESVSFTSPVEATGVFELNAQPDLLAPFEGIGVDADWEFRLPRAANAIDFAGIADVLVTLDYTALDSPDLRTEVLRKLDPERVGERPFLFRFDFADAWYDLHNPDQVEPPAQPMVVSFDLRAGDFPSNLADLTIRHVALLCTRRDGATFEVEIRNLRYESGQRSYESGAVTTVDGLVSSRRASGFRFTGFQGLPVAGRWTLTFDPAYRRFADRDIEDMLLVVSYAGLAPDWPT